MIQYPDNLESKFKFVALSALRCEQLQKGAKPRVTASTQKFTTVAQEEVLAGEVREMTPEEITAAQEAAAVEAAALEPTEVETETETETLEAGS